MSKQINPQTIKFNGIVKDVLDCYYYGNLKEVNSFKDELTVLNLLQKEISKRKKLVKGWLKN
jgi:hypothetical protein